MNRIYNITIDKFFDENLKLFANNLSSNEEIVSTSVVPMFGESRFVICTRKVEQLVDTKHRNLLLEEVAKIAKK